VRPGRRSEPGVPVASGERLLASAERADGADPVGGTRDALYLPQRVPWEAIASADWDREAETLRVVELGEFGWEQPVHRLPLRAPDRLLQLVRERITASFVLQRHVDVRHGRRVRILARRRPAGGDVHWYVDYDAGLEPEDPEVASVVEAALTTARAEVGA
jgi:hypothetical protein